MLRFALRISLSLLRYVLALLIATMSSHFWGKQVSLMRTVSSLRKITTPLKLARRPNPSVLEIWKLGIWKCSTRYCEHEDGAQEIDAAVLCGMYIHPFEACLPTGIQE